MTPPHPAVASPWSRVPAGLWVLLIVALWVFGLGHAPLIDVDEGAFSEASREMLASGDWGHTTLNGVDRFDKPILIYWFQSAALLMFGDNAFATRLPSAIAALFWCLGVVRFAQLWLGPAAIRPAAVILSSALGVMLIGRAATADALLNALMCWSCLDLYKHLSTGSKAALRRAFFWMGLGLLTKGPVACLIPGMAVVVYLLSSGEIKRLRAVLTDVPAWFIVMLTAVPWYAYALNRHGMAFIDGFIWQHNVNRFLHAKEGHGGASYYTLLVAPLLALPWTPLLVITLSRLRALWAQAAPRFLLCWSGFALLFFSLSSTKLPHYLLYGITPLLILMTQALLEMQSKRLAWSLAITQLLLYGALAASHLLAPRLASQTPDALYQALLSAPAAAPALQWIAAGLLAWVLSWLWPGLQLAERAMLGAVLGVCWSVQVVIPWWASTLQAPVVHLAAVARAHGGPVTQWQTRQPSFGFYLGASTPAGPPPVGGLALTRKDRLPTDAGTLSRLEIIAQDHGFVLIKQH